MTRYVYVAGRLSGDPPTYLANLAEMCAASRRLMDMGLTPINPGADMLEGLMSGEVMDCTPVKVCAPVPPLVSSSVQLVAYPVNSPAVLNVHVKGPVAVRVM